MFENDFFECGDDVCDGPGPPPKFQMPPPPRPPFMQDLNAVLGTTIECTEDGQFDLDVCAAIPVSLSTTFLFLLNVKVFFFYGTVQEKFGEY